MEPYFSEHFWVGVSETWRYPKHNKSWETGDVSNWALLLFQRGEGSIRTQTSEMHFQKHDAVLISPGHPHTFYAGPEWVIFWIHFILPEELREKVKKWPETAPGFRTFHLSDIVFHKISMSMHEIFLLSQTQPNNWFDFSKSLLAEMLYRIDNFIPHYDNNPDSEWLTEAIMQLITIPMVNIDTIAQQCNMSHTRFYSEFRRLTGHSPSEFRNARRMKEAEHLLVSTCHPVSQIARMLGFSTPFYFSLQFKNAHGISPTEYRQQIQTNE